MCGGLRFFIGLRLAEHFNLKRPDAKSRYLAGLSNAI
jgi:hypothetical protein